MNISKPSTATSSTIKISHPELVALAQWLAVGFSYSWWAVIIVYYGLFNGGISIGYQLHSLPIVVVSLALISILKLAMKQNKKLLIGLSVLGLFVSGLLA